MTRITVPVLALVLLAAPALLQAQQRAGGGGGGRGGLQQQNPIEAILVRRDSLQLGLSQDQVTRLTALRDELNTKNAPHQQAVTAALARVQGGDQSAMAEIQTHQAPITEANNAAVQSARGILNAEQWTKVEGMLQTLQAGRGRGGAGGGGGGGGGRGGPPGGE
jgi:hypothetical protein